MAGTWDGYPAAELYINRQPVWTYTPSAERLTTLSILKLLPAYADVRVDEAGVINERTGLPQESNDLRDTIGRTSGRAEPGIGQTSYQGR